MKDLDFERRSNLRIGVGGLLLLHGPERIFKRLTQNGRLEYVNWFYLRLWRTLEPGWTARTDTHERV